MRFTMLVIGDDWEGQLEPFDFALAVDPYPEYVNGDELQYASNYFRMRRWLPDPTIPADGGANAQPEEHSLREAQYLTALESDFDPVTCCRLLNSPEEELHEDERGLYRWSTFNPQGRFDYYSHVVEGSPGALLLKASGGGLPGGLLRSWRGRRVPAAAPETTDQARVGQVDFDTMAAQAAERAAADWATVARVVDELGPLPDPGDEAFVGHPVVSAVSTALGNRAYEYTWAAFRRSRQSFLDLARLRAWLPAYGYVHEGQWFEPQSGEATDDFYRDAAALVRSRPPDTLVTVVRLHA